MSLFYFTLQSFDFLIQKNQLVVVMIDFVLFFDLFLLGVVIQNHFKSFPIMLKDIIYLVHLSELFDKVDVILKTSNHLNDLAFAFSNVVVIGEQKLFGFILVELIVCLEWAFDV